MGGEETDILKEKGKSVGWAGDLGRRIIFGGKNAKEGDYV